MTHVWDRQLQMKMMIIATLRAVTAQAIFKLIGAAGLDPQKQDPQIRCFSQEVYTGARKCGDANSTPTDYLELTQGYQEAVVSSMSPFKASIYKDLKFHNPGQVF